MASYNLFRTILLVSCLVATHCILIDCDYFGVTIHNCIKISFSSLMECVNKYTPGIQSSNKCPPTYEAESMQCYPDALVNTTFEFECNPYYFKRGRGKANCYANKTIGGGYTHHCEPLPKDVQMLRFNYLLIKYNISSGKKDKFEKERKVHNDRIEKIIKTLRIIDLTVCVSAFIILAILIPWKKERIMLHRMLILSFIFNDIANIFILFEYPFSEHADHIVGIRDEKLRKKNEDCNYVSVLERYFFLCIICWMFNEAFFQFRQFFFVFLEKSYLWIYFIFGWGFPFVIAFGAYLPSMVNDPPFEENIVCWMFTSVHVKNNLILIVPIIVMLFLNMCIMAYLMWIIWSKLKTGTQSLEMKNAKKSARGFIVVLVLLGGGYVFSIYTPDECPELGYFRAIVIPLQGFLVCVFHVFLSREVIDSVLKKMRVMSEADNIRSDATNSTRRFSLFPRKDSRNPSVVSISSTGNQPRISRKESLPSYPTVEEIVKGEDEKVQITDKFPTNSEMLEMNGFNVGVVEIYDDVAYTDSADNTLQNGAVLNTGFNMEDEDNNNKDLNENAQEPPLTT